MQIANFHSDLLSYLTGGSERTPYDLFARGAIPQLLSGGVAWETLAIYVKTALGSVEKGQAQFDLFCHLPHRYLEFQKKIQTFLSIENASAFCSEQEPLQAGLNRLERWSKKGIAYISLTWNDENRFGGGNASQAGLKADGCEILRWMSGKKIAIDLSHTSDALAYGVLNLIDRERLDIVPVASHSNFRAVADLPRNLPDEVAQEIVSRGGLIGLVFVRRFLGQYGSQDFLRQLHHAEKIGVLDRMCLGADFFDDRDYSKELAHLLPMFISGFEDASCFPKFLELIKPSFSQEVIEKIAYRNLQHFLIR